MNAQQQETQIPSAVITPSTGRNKLSRMAALFMALALGATACGNSGSDDSSGDADTNSFERIEEAEDDGDAESDFVSGSDDSDEDAMEDDSETAGSVDEDASAGDEASDDGFSIVEGDTAEQAEAPDGGFFEEPEEETDKEDNNTFEDYGVRPFVEAADDPFSTFALDVDTASYTISQQWLSQGSLPPVESVRVEEFVNSFDYDYRAPDDGLTAVADGGPSPFNSDNVIVRIGVQAEDVSNRERPNANLTFVIDTSGSMDRDDRLGLVKESLTRLVEQLDRGDKIAIVTYSGDAEILLEPTDIRDEDIILDAIDSLRPNGSTNFEAGLEAAYDLANEAFDEDEINRVILASDGVANVGITDPDELVAGIRRDADRGIQLVTLGVGMGNFNDVVLETLADDGDGFYAYINTIEEADKLFGEDLVSTLLTVAIDGKIQVEWNEDVVDEYRLLGFENRAVRDDDFRNDAVDAGELGADHQVTAIYELDLHRGVRDNESLGTAALRWEDPDTGEVIEGQLGLDVSIIEDSWGDTREDFRLAVTVASFAEILRDSQYADEISLEQVRQEAEALVDRDEEIETLVEMIEQAQDLGR